MLIPGSFKIRTGLWGAGVGTLPDSFARHEHAVSPVSQRVMSLDTFVLKYLTFLLEPRVVTGVTMVHFQD